MPMGWTARRTPKPGSPGATPQPGDSSPGVPAPGILRASRRHAEIACVGDLAAPAARAPPDAPTSGGFIPRDPGSANGTLLNGQRLTAPTRLHDGDVIEIADATFTLIRADCLLCLYLVQHVQAQHEGGKHYGRRYSHHQHTGSSLGATCPGGKEATATRRMPDSWSEAPSMSVV